MEEIKLTATEESNIPLSEILVNTFETVFYKEKALTININGIRVIMFPDKQ